MTQESTRTVELPAVLSAQAAFIVHVTGSEPGTSNAIAGRVEHVTSGRSLRFRSAAELTEFMQQALMGL